MSEFLDKLNDAATNFENKQSQQEAQVEKLNDPKERYYSCLCNFVEFFKNIVSDFVDKGEYSNTNSKRSIKGTIELKRTRVQCPYADDPDYTIKNISIRINNNIKSMPDGHIPSVGLAGGSIDSYVQRLYNQLFEYAGPCFMEKEKRVENKRSALDYLIGMPKYQTITEFIPNNTFNDSFVEQFVQMMNGDVDITKNSIPTHEESSEYVARSSVKKTTTTEIKEYEFRIDFR